MIVPIFGIVFAVLGILTIGLVFIPLAVLFTFIGLLSGAAELRAGVFLMSVVSGILTVVGFVASPALQAATLLILAAVLGAH